MPSVGLARVALAATLALTTACHGGGESAATQAPSAPGALRVMPLGDSITEGANGAATYRYYLQHDLERLGVSVDFVGSQSGVHGGKPRFSDFDADHEGHWGWRTGDVLARMDKWAAASRPDVVLIHLGTNDLVGEPSVIVTNLSAIIDSLRRANPDVVVFLARLIPPAGFPQDRLTAANDAIEAMGRQKSTERSPVEIVAQDEGFDPAVDSYDGLHPNDAGERKMAEKWSRAIEAWRKARSTPSPAVQKRGQTPFPLRNVV